MFNKAKRGVSRMVHRSGGLSRDPLALIHVARRDCHLGEDDYRALLAGAAGVTSAKDLDETGFLVVLARFKALGFVHRPSAAAAPRAPAALTFGQRKRMATPAQIQMVRRMWEAWHGRADDGALNTWIERRFGPTNIRFATVQVAQMAIEGLKAMLARRHAAAVGTVGEVTE